MIRSDSSRRDSTPRSPSSPGSPGPRRPKLLRATATSPSLAAAMPGQDGPRPSVLSSSNSSNQRATDLLNRFSGAVDHPPSSPRRVEVAIVDDHASTHDEDSLCYGSSLGTTSSNSSSATDMDKDQSTNQGYHRRTDSGNYISFPSFDTWEPEQPEEKTEGALNTTPG